MRERESAREVNSMNAKFHALVIAAACASAAPALADPVKVVAAENFYGDLATQIGGANVAVTSILSSPDQDPHPFEANPQTAKALTDAQIVIGHRGGHPPRNEQLL